MYPFRALQQPHISCQYSKEIPEGSLILGNSTNHDHYPQSSLLKISLRVVTKSANWCNWKSYGVLTLPWEAQSCLGLVRMSITRGLELPHLSHYTDPKFHWKTVISYMLGLARRYMSVVGILDLIRCQFLRYALLWSFWDSILPRSTQWEWEKSLLSSRKSKISLIILKWQKSQLPGSWWASLDTKRL